MIEIKITGDTPLEALASVTAFGMHCLADKAVHNAANQIFDAEQAKGRKEAVEDSKPDTISSTTAQASVDSPPAACEESLQDTPVPEQPEQKREEQSKPPTLVEVRAKGLEMAKKHGQPAVKAILESFGVPSMTHLAEGDRAAFLEKLEELNRQGDKNA